MRPRFAFRCPSKQREQGMPDARCTRGLVCKTGNEKRTRAYRFSGGNPTFPAQWLYGLCRDLPGDEFVLSPSSADMDCLSPVGPTRLRRLSTSNGCQNHTVLPYATTPFVCAPFAAHGSFANPPCDHITRLTPPRPPHPIPTFGDDGQRPFLGDRMAGVLKMICPTAKAKICPSGCFAAARQGWPPRLPHGEERVGGAIALPTRVSNHRAQSPAAILRDAAQRGAAPQDEDR